MLKFTNVRKSIQDPFAASAGPCIYDPETGNVVTNDSRRLPVIIGVVHTEEFTRLLKRRSGIAVSLAVYAESGAGYWVTIAAT